MDTGEHVRMVSWMRKDSCTVEPLHTGTDHFDRGKNLLSLYRLVHREVSFIQRCPLFLAPLYTYLDSYDGTGRGQRSFPRQYEIGLRGSDAISIGNVWRRKIVHFIVKNYPILRHDFGTKIRVHRPGKDHFSTWQF